MLITISFTMAIAIAINITRTAQALCISEDRNALTMKEERKKQICSHNSHSNPWKIKFVYTFRMGEIRQSAEACRFVALARKHNPLENGKKAKK